MSVTNYKELYEDVKRELKDAHDTIIVMNDYIEQLEEALGEFGVEATKEDLLFGGIGSGSNHNQLSLFDDPDDYDWGDLR